MKIFILVDDVKCRGGFEAEHGFSAYFEADGRSFLFDLGASDLFLRNAGKLGLDLSDVDFLVFSHGHYDHTGGWPFFKPGRRTQVLAHPHALLPKFKGKRVIGFPPEADLRPIRTVETPVALTEHVWYLGRIPGESRPTLGRFLKDGLLREDGLWDDTALAIVGEEETILLAGCAHAGIVSIVAYADKLFPGRKTAILGGFHMRDFSRPDIDRILGELKRLGVTRAYPGHCTGRAAISALLGSFAGERLFSGKVVDF